MADNDLHRLDEWLGTIIAGLAPPARRRWALRLAKLLRQANATRISKNIEPDGSPMEARRSRLDRRGGLRRASRKRMFRGLKKIGNWAIAADEDGLEIRPVNGLVDRIASISQFGEVATVGRLRDGRTIRARYATRRLLGFSDDDEALINELAADLIEHPAR